MSEPSRQEREALLELLLALGGPLIWTGPIPFDALAARHATEQTSAVPAAPAPDADEPLTASGNGSGRGRHAA